MGFSRVADLRICGFAKESEEGYEKVEPVEGDEKGDTVIWSRLRSAWYK